MALWAQNQYSVSERAVSSPGLELTKYNFEYSKGSFRWNVQIYMPIEGYSKYLNYACEISLGWQRFSQSIWKQN